jgi:hypothetical protein
MNTSPHKVAVASVLALAADQLRRAFAAPTWLLLAGLLALVCAPRAQAGQQIINTGNFSWPGGTMSVSANVIVGRYSSTSSFTGNFAAAATLYASDGSTVASYTSTGGTATVAAGDAGIGDVLDAATINFGNISAGTYYIIYTGTRTAYSSDVGGYWFAYWDSTPTPSLTATSFSVSPTSFTYNGGAQGPTISPNPSNATYAVSGTASATNAGSYSVQADANGLFTGSSGSVAWTINPASASFGLSSTAFTYNGAAQGPSVTASPAGATFTTGGTLSATAAGTYTATATANGNYGGSNGSLTWTINKAAQSIAFTNPGTKQKDSGSMTLSASAPGGAVVFSVLSGPASVSGSTLTFTGSGYVQVQAAQGGGSNYNAAPNATQTFFVNGDPTITQAILDGSNNVLATNTVTNGSAANGAANATVYFGQTWKFQVSGTDPNSTLTWLLFRMQRPGGVPGSTNPDATDGFVLSGTEWNWDNNFASTNAKTITTTGILADTVGSWPVWSHAENANALGWGSVSGWNGQQYGWQSSSGVASLTVAKATPSASFPTGRTFSPAGTSYTVVAADLNAVFSNPYSGSVTAPTGAVTYTLVGPGTAVTAGTVLRGGAYYTIQANYPGDANYNATTATSSWHVNGPPGDADNDGVPDAIELQLGTNPNVACQPDTSNQTQLKITKPQQ